jgi:environmental stress-induced protein Ves
MRLTHLTARDYKRMSWKNGGGITTELLLEQGDDGSAAWRLSIAEVTKSGPFSDFSGYARTIMLIDGPGFVLDFEAHPQKRLDRRYEPFPFDGGWKTGCTLIDGPVRDFNLIVANAAGPASLTVAEPQRGGMQIEAAKTVIFHVLQGDAAVSGHAVPQGDTLRIDAPILPLSLDAPESATVAVIRIGA